METVLFGKSVALGLAIAAPLGPIGALCITRTLQRGFWAGVAGGLGTALADAFYASLAAIGFAAFTATLAWLSVPLKLFGGLFMLWLGWKTAFPAKSSTVLPLGKQDLLGTTVATFLLTITNPLTILSFAALFAGLGLGDNADIGRAAVVIAGVFAGSLGWWFLLSGAVALMKAKLPQGFALWVSRLSALVLIGFGLYALGSVVLDFVPFSGLSQSQP